MNLRASQVLGLHVETACKQMNDNEGRSASRSLRQVVSGQVIQQNPNVS